MTKLEKKLRAVAPKVAKKYAIQSISLFGSCARAQENADSDVDLLVVFSKPVSFFDLVRAEEEFSKLIEKKTEIVTEAALNYRIRSYVDRDKKLIYEG